MATESQSPSAGKSATGESKAGRRFAIVAIVLIGGIISLNVAAKGLDHAVGGNEPSGVAGSSYGTQSTGLAAAASLFADYGHPIVRQRGSLVSATLDPHMTLFVIEPETLTEDDEATLLEFVSRGGRLVIGGSQPFYLHGLRDHPPEWDPNGLKTYAEIAPILGAREVETAGQGVWTDPGSGTVYATRATRRCSPRKTSDSARSTFSPTRRRSRTTISAAPTTPRSHSGSRVTSRERSALPREHAGTAKPAVSARSRRRGRSHW